MSSASLPKRRSLRRRSARIPIWRVPGRVNWELYRCPGWRCAERQLDQAFDRAAAWLAAALSAGLPLDTALDRAFHEKMGPTMHSCAEWGAVDTEPCANVRLALAELSSRYVGS